MGLQRKHRRIKLGVPESIGLGLMFACAVAAIWTYTELSQTQWVSTTARVLAIQVAPPTPTPFSPISEGNNGVNVRYQFMIGSTPVEGNWRGNWIINPILNKTAPDLLEQLKNGATEFSAQPQPVPTNLGTSEYSRSTRGEDFYNVASQRRKSVTHVALTQPETDELTGFVPPEKGESVYLDTTLEARPALDLNIRYNPHDPDLSVLDYPGFNLLVPAVIVDAVLLLILLGYFTRTYPRLKLAGY